MPLSLSSKSFSLHRLSVILPFDAVSSSYWQHFEIIHQKVSLCRFPVTLLSSSLFTTIHQWIFLQQLVSSFFSYHFAQQFVLTPSSYTSETTSEAPFLCQEEIWYCLIQFGNHKLSISAGWLKLIKCSCMVLLISSVYISLSPKLTFSAKKLNVTAFWYTTSCR